MNAGQQGGRSPLARAVVRSLPAVGRLVRQRDDLEQQVRHLVRQQARLRRRNAQLRQEKRDLRTELMDAPAEQQHLREVGSRTDLRFLFIVTYGRSGSTLLQGILSSIPGYLIRGENGGTPYHLYQFHTNALRRRAARPLDWRSPANAWFGIGGYPTQIALDELRRLMLATVIRPEPESRVVGFKEIRWLQEDLHDYVDFLRAVFPGARFVINTRNLDDVAVSKWWGRDAGSRDIIARAEERMLALLERLGDDAFHIRYDDYVADPGRLQALFDWLGEELDEDRISRVLATRHSY